MEKLAAVVIGAGVIGLACARALARRGRETLIIERNEAFGLETSSRNSEVIHAGLYYAQDSLKARLCVAGQRQLYEFCAENAVAHRRCGKLVVATANAQLARLHALHAQGEANGVADLRLLSGREAHALEPELACCAALHSPSTGIVDSHALMLALLADAERHGALLVLRSPVVGGTVDASGIVLAVGGAEPSRLRAGIVINAAGLSATHFARTLSGFPPRCLPVNGYAKGNYFSLQRPAPFSRLIYPLPESGGLGVHLTLDLAGQARFGPDVEWLPEAPASAPPPAFDYRVDPARGAAFYREIRRYWPALPDGALAPAYAGIRPKLGGRTQPATDFLIQGPAEHGVDGLVNLFGLESPGLTACLAIAEHVSALLAVG